jgi:hypothetical protein
MKTILVTSLGIAVPLLLAFLGTNGQPALAWAAVPIAWWAGFRARGYEIQSRQASDSTPSKQRPKASFQASNASLPNN